MFLTDQDYKKFAEKYNLKILEGHCSCGKSTLKTDIPFYDNGYAGLKSKASECCGSSKMTRITTKKETAEKWAKLINPFLGIV